MKAIVEIALLTTILVLSGCKGVEEIFPEDEYSFLSDSVQITSLQDSVLQYENNDSIESKNPIGSIVILNDRFPPCIIPWWPESKLPDGVIIEYMPITCGPWLVPTPEKDLREDNTNSITLDYQLPNNELEAILSPACFEVESFPSTTSSGKETLILTVYKAGYLDITVRNENAEQVVKILSQYTEVGQYSFEIDLSNHYNGDYFVCIELGPDQKILHLKREDAGLVHS